MSTIQAWYFGAADRKLRYGDNRQACAGRTHRVDGELIMCKRGLHASRCLMDALGLGSGPYVWRVVLSGNIIEASDKLCASERTYLWGYNAESVLRVFARKCALDVLHLWDAPDVVAHYLRSGDELSREAARSAADAAWSAAAAAAWSAAWSAAGAAAWAAAWPAGDAAWSAWSAAAAAAWSAAGDAAWSAAGARQTERLTEMIYAEARRLKKEV